MRTGCDYWMDLLWDTPSTHHDIWEMAQVPNAATELRDFLYVRVVRHLACSADPTVGAMLCLLLMKMRDALGQYMELVISKGNPDHS